VGALGRSLRRVHDLHNLCGHQVGGVQHQRHQVLLRQAHTAPVGEAHLQARPPHVLRHFAEDALHDLLKLLDLTVYTVGNVAVAYSRVTKDLQEEVLRASKGQPRLSHLHGVECLRQLAVQELRRHAHALRRPLQGQVVAQFAAHARVRDGGHLGHLGQLTVQLGQNLLDLPGAGSRSPWSRCTPGPAARGTGAGAARPACPVGPTAGSRPRPAPGRPPARSAQAPASSRLPSSSSYSDNHPCTLRTRRKLLAASDDTTLRSLYSESVFDSPSSRILFAKAESHRSFTFTLVSGRSKVLVARRAPSAR
jgi:hypothetical protein